MGGLVSLIMLELEPLLRLVDLCSLLEVEGHVVLGDLTAVALNVDSQNEVALLQTVVQGFETGGLY